jgi:hypothetical protein
MISVDIGTMNRGIMEGQAGFDHTGNAVEPLGAGPRSALGYRLNRGFSSPRYSEHPMLTS